MFSESEVLVINPRAPSRWVTIMSYEDDCEVGNINHYSNPNVMFRGKATGNATANCAAGIIAHMVSLAKAHEGAVTSPKPSILDVVFGVVPSTIISP